MKYKYYTELIIFTVLLVIISFFLDWKAFIVNLSVLLIGLVIIEKYYRSIEVKRFRKTYKLLLETLARQIGELLIKYDLILGTNENFLSNVYNPHWGRPEKEFIDSFKQFLKNIEKYLKEDYKNMSSKMANQIYDDFHSLNKVSTNEISEIFSLLNPSLTVIGISQDLISLIITAKAKYYEFIRYITDLDAYTSFEEQVETFIDFLNILFKIVNVIVKKYKEIDK